MNERIRELLKQATHTTNHYGFDQTYVDHEKFAELIVRECISESLAEIVPDEEIAKESDPVIREYLKGNNHGIIDAVVRFRNYFGVEE